jgi:thioredoxin reductase
MAKAELKKYKVRTMNDEVRTATRTRDSGFQIDTVKNNTYFSKKLIIATGLRDNIPQIEGFQQFYGKSVFHCPYCDGWEVRDRQLGVYARNKNGFDLALSLRNWSDHITLYTDGRNYLTPRQREFLKAHEIIIDPNRISRLEGAGAQLKNIVFLNESKRRCDALFFVNGYTQQSNIMVGLGCSMSNKGVAMTNRQQQTNIAGVYVAGDAAREMHFVVMAAAEGAKAAVTINKELQLEERKVILS